MFATVQWSKAMLLELAMHLHLSAVVMEMQNNYVSSQQ